MIRAYRWQRRNPAPFHWLSRKTLVCDVGLRPSDDVMIDDLVDSLTKASPCGRSWATRKQIWSKYSGKRRYPTRQCNLRYDTALPEQSKRHQHICLVGTHVLMPLLYFSHGDPSEVDLKIKRLLQRWSYWREHLKYVWNVYCDVTNHRRGHHTTKVARLLFWLFARFTIYLRARYFDIYIYSRPSQIRIHDVLLY